MAQDGVEQDGDGGVPARATARNVAVALHHNPEAADLPRVVASGRGLVADQIVNLAFAHGVKVREDADLAQILSLIDLDSDIPVEAMAAVAEILAYLYRANAAAPPMTGALRPSPDTPPFAGPAGVKAP